MSEDADNKNDAAPKDEAAPVVHTATLSEPKAELGKEDKAKKPRLSRKERKEQAKREYKHLRAQYNSWWSFYYAEQIIKPYGSIPNWLWKGTIKPIGTVIIIVIVFRSMLFDWNDVPTGSMEPEIHVGDRIAVNRLSYGLQFPLTGPQIGVPFTPLQWDNPLDSIPQIGWGDGPQRGDIVTFWNPITDVRMVKRIVAGPGDTIEFRNSEMILNGTRATYEDVDPIAEDLPLNTKYKDRDPNLGIIKTVSKSLTYRRETIEGEVRVTQHIESRWGFQTIIVRPDGTLQIAYEREVKEQGPVPALAVETPIDEFLAKQTDLEVIAKVRDGQILIDGEEAGYHDFAELLLSRIEDETITQTLDKIGLGFKGPDLLVDGEPVFTEVFNHAINERKDQLSESDLQILALFLEVYQSLRQALYTNFGAYTLGPDEYFMVGDNRNNSSDGRYFGPVKRSEITGKAFAVAFSFKDNKMFALPPEPAWTRFFKDLD